MVFFSSGILLLVALAVWVFCIIDVITTDQSQIRNLPKLAWVFIVLLFGDFGSIAWLVAGRQWNKSSVPSGAARPSLFSWGGTSAPSATQHPETITPARRVPMNPDDDEAFLAQLRARAEEQRRRAKEQNPPEQNSPDQPE